MLTREDLAAIRGYWKTRKAEFGLSLDEREQILALLADLGAAERFGYRCLAHEGDVAEGRCVCCEVAQVAKLAAALRDIEAHAHRMREYVPCEMCCHAVAVDREDLQAIRRRAAAAGGKNNVIRE